MNYLIWALHTFGCHAYISGNALKPVLQLLIILKCRSLIVLILVLKVLLVWELLLDKL